MRLDRPAASLARIILVLGIVASMPASGLAQSGMNLIAHYVEVLPAADGSSYNVNVYLSVLDTLGAPVPDLQAENFVILEDGQKVEIQKSGPLTEEPTHVVLVMDTSGSMDGAFIKAARNAATSFVSGLKSNDPVALLTFDDQVKIRKDFVADQAAITAEIETINAKTESGTCLYDAAYSAVAMFDTHPPPPGNRAVILFTDGRDETPNGARCSKHTVQEVIELASKGELRTPIFTVGLGLEKKIATDVLKSFAEQTGGLYVYSPNSGDLTGAFQEFSNQLRAQYVLTYQSISAAGEHKLAVSLHLAGSEAPPPDDRGTRVFLLPVLAPHISFLSPAEGETIHDQLKISVALSSQGQTLIQRVSFEVNGVLAGSDDTKPYELELDAQQYPAGVMTVLAIAYGENNVELARSSVNLLHEEILEATAVLPMEEPVLVATAPGPEEDTRTSNPMIAMSIFLSALSIVSIGLLIFFLVRQQNRAKVQELESYVAGDAPMPSMQGIPVYRKVEETRKTGSTGPGSDVLGALTIEASDDSSLIGHRFEITTPLVTLGRSADNDINFPSDKPVSRHHAEIYQISGKLYLREVEMADASGMARPPKYGTFLNKSPMGPEPALLKTGDEIQLGKRVRLKFEAYQQASDEDASTYDDMTASADDMDRTQEQ
jgi:VWFA-related protein